MQSFEALLDSEDVPLYLLDAILVDRSHIFGTSTENVSGQTSYVLEDKSRFQDYHPDNSLFKYEIYELMFHRCQRCTRNFIAFAKFVVQLN